MNKSSLHAIPVVPWNQRILEKHPKSEPDFWPDELKLKYMALEIEDLRVRLEKATVTAPPSDEIKNLQDGFRAGWTVSAGWAGRDDLIADIASPAYLRDMAQALAPLVNIQSAALTDDLSGIPDSSVPNAQMPLSAAQPILPADENIESIEEKRACRCESCVPQGDLLHPENMRMIVCATCGNKRCPHATDHRNTCTSSNEPGQKGSSWEHVLPFGSSLKSPAPLPSVPSHVINAISAYGDARADDGDSATALGNVIAGIRGLLDIEKPVQTTPAASTHDSACVDSTPGLQVGSSSFEAWYASHKKACSGDKQLARDAYSAGMGDPLVTCAQPAQKNEVNEPIEPIEPIFSEESRLSKYLAANYPGTPGETLTDRVIEALEEMDIALGYQSGVESGLLSPRQRKYTPSAQPSYMDGVNTERLTKALSWLGIASPCSQESYISEMAFYVNALTLAIMGQKMQFQSDNPIIR